MAKNVETKTDFSAVNRWLEENVLTMLMEKCESPLTDDGEKGTELTLPKGISRYPNNALFGVLFWISALIFCCGFGKIATR